MKKLVCAGPTIYDATMTKTPGVMGTNRTDRTDECINAVAQHMLEMAKRNQDTPGAFQYEWPGIGRLTWVSESATPPVPQPYSAEEVRKLPKGTLVLYEYMGDSKDERDKKSVWVFEGIHGANMASLEGDDNTLEHSRGMMLDLTLDYGKDPYGWRLWPYTPDAED